MNGLIMRLEKFNEKDTKVRAVLRRSLAFEPGAYIGAYQYVEPLIKDGFSLWWRESYYLLAGLWALHWREGRIGIPISIGEACALLDCENRKKMRFEDRWKITSTEKRFITMLDADSGQLPYRLRQMISLLKDYNIDFEDLLKRLLYWNDDHKSTQIAYVRSYYKTLNSILGEEPTTLEEENK